MATYLEGPFGEKSSKRLIAIILITLGCAIGTIASIYGLFHKIPSSHFILDAFITFISGGVIVELGTIADIIKLFVNRRT